MAIDYVAEIYGVSKKELTNTIRYESSFLPTAKNSTSPAYGIAQFFPSTFKLYCTGDYKSPKDQLLCMGKMWHDNYYNRYQWEAWTKLYLK